MNKALSEGMKYTHHGLTMVVLFLLCLGGGYWLDGRFNSSPVGTVAGVVIGVIVGGGYFVLEIIELATEGVSDRDDDDETS